MVGQINHLLRHTEETLKRSRHRLGNLGHALEIALAVLLSSSAATSCAPSGAARQPARAVAADRAAPAARAGPRAAGRRGAARRRISTAAASCRRCAPPWRQIHPHVDIDWQAPPGLRLPWDGEDLLEALGNLLDNACKWADSAVRVSAGEDGEGYWLCVEDDGPGIDPAQREAVIARGSRLDEQVAGHGLGLGIVRDIAQACGGTLSLEDSGELGRAVRAAAPAPGAPRPWGGPERAARGITRRAWAAGVSLVDGGRIGRAEARLFAGQGLEEGGDLADFIVAELAAQLQAGHHVHRLFQLPVGTVVEVGVGQLDVAQGRHLELEAVGVLAGQRGDALGRVVGLVGFDQAHLLEGVAASGRAVVAGGAAGVLEQLVAFQLDLGQGFLVAEQPVVEARVAG